MSGQQTQQQTGIFGEEYCAQPTEPEGPAKLVPLQAQTDIPPTATSSPTAQATAVLPQPSASTQPEQKELSDEAKTTLRQVKEAFDTSLRRRITEIVNGQEITVSGNPWLIPGDLSTMNGQFHGALGNARSNFKDPEKSDQYQELANTYSAALDAALQTTGREDRKIALEVLKLSNIAAPTSAIAARIDTSGAHPTNMFFPKDKNDFNTKYEQIFGPSGLIDGRLTTINEIVDHCEAAIQTTKVSEDAIEVLKSHGFDPRDDAVKNIVEKYKLDEEGFLRIEKNCFVISFLSAEKNELESLTKFNTKEDLRLAWNTNKERLDNLYAAYKKAKNQQDFENIIGNIHMVLGVARDGLGAAHGGVIVADEAHDIGKRGRPGSWW